MRLAAFATVLTLSGCVSISESKPVTVAPSAMRCVTGEPMVETILFLGLARPGGSVSEEEFGRFVETEVVPRWKEGFIILSGQGLWYSEQRQITEREPSRVLVRFHDGDAEASADIEAIRAAYVSAFAQDAVLRTDRMTCADF